MENILESAKEITSEQYMKLSNPIFMGQTRLDENKMYWMVFQNEEQFYKVHNKPYNYNDL